MQTVSDETLMTRVSATGDREAFTELVQRHKSRAYLLALKLLGDHDDAMDVSQEAFVKLYQKADRYENGRAFWPWFAAILRNNARSLIRFRLRRKKAGAEELITHLADETADSSAPARVAELWRAVLDLPLKLREVIVLRHFEQFSYREIAQTLSIPENTVASRLHEARKRLADAM